MQVQVMQKALDGAFCITFGLHSVTTCLSLGIFFFGHLIQVWLLICISAFNVLAVDLE